MPIPEPRPGRAALVTGASSGIGEALARDLAARGHDVVLVARRRDRLEKLAAELTERHRCTAHVLTCDLAEVDARAVLLRELAGLGLELDVLVLCAGFGGVGPFLAQDPDTMVMMVRTNVEGTVALSRALLPAMVARSRGAVLFVSSMAGNQPMLNFTPYAATKAAVTSLAEALHAELRPAGITVTALCPALVATEFSAVAQAHEQVKRQPAFLTANAQQCSTAALKGLDGGRRVVVPLVSVRVFAFIAEHLPTVLWLPISRRMLAP